MKKIKIFCVMLLVSLFTVPMIVFAADSSFSLGDGDNFQGGEKKLEYNYPIIQFNNHNLSTDGQLAASIMKKGLFGFSLKSRQEKWVKNIQNVYFYYDNYGSGTYKPVFVANKINGTGYIAGSYTLTSMPN